MSAQTKPMSRYVYTEQARGHSLHYMLRRCMHYAWCASLAIANRRKLLVTTEFAPASKNMLCGHFKIVKKYPLTSCVLAFLEVVLKRMTHLTRWNSCSTGHSSRDTKPSSTEPFAGRWLPCVCTRLLHTAPTTPAVSKSFLYLVHPQVQDFCMGHGTETRLREAQYCHYSTIPKEILLQKN